MRLSILVVAASVVCGGVAAAEPADADVDGAERLLADDGTATPADAARGLALLLKAAEAGDGRAQYRLGTLFLTGRVVTQDDGTAAYWLTRAAEAGIGAAESNLGLLTLQGRGVARDPQAAAVLLRRAAAKDIAAAQHNLGWMAQMGEGMAPSRAEALRWYSAAAQSGYSPSQYNLGVLLADGDGGEGTADPAGAVKWLSLAGLSRHPDVHRQATARLVELSRAVPPEAVATGLDDARRWLASGRVQ
ncbi:MAG: tetratricopeptide repeat protein [Bacteroidota bacterium]